MSSIIQLRYVNIHQMISTIYYIKQYHMNLSANPTNFTASKFALVISPGLLNNSLRPVSRPHLIYRTNN